MSNQIKRAVLRRQGQPLPQRQPRGRRHGGGEPSPLMFEAIERRLKNKECPVCGARIHERPDHFKHKQLDMPICVNGHRQDIWEPQRPEAVAKRKAEAEKAKAAGEVTAKVETGLRAKFRKLTTPKK